MALKDLRVDLDQSPGTAPLQAALILAQRLNVHLTALHLIAEPFLGGGRHLPAEVMREHLAHAEAEARDPCVGPRGRRATQRRTRAVRESGSLDKLPTLLARHARYPISP